MSQPILVPIDLHQHAVFKSVFDAAMDYARLHDAEIHLVTVLPDLDSILLPYIDDQTIREAVEDARKELEQVAIQYIGDAHEWTAEAVTGRVASTIIRMADQRQVSLIVVASHNPLFSDVFFGSVAARVVQRSNRSVLVVRQHSDTT